jgi:hypothetical protein
MAEHNEATQQFETKPREDLTEVARKVRAAGAGAEAQARF